MDKKKAGFELSRFEGEVDSHFICPVCTNAVFSPVECSLCEHLICASCSQAGETCPHCKERLVTKAVALFANKIYTRLQLHCANQANGCDFHSAISDISSHESECLYVTVTCASPICSNTFMKKDKLAVEGEPLVCSVVCKTVVDFKQVLDGKDQVEILKQFHKFLNEAKSLVETQVRADLEPMQKEIDRKLQEAREFAKARDALLAELEDRKWKYHPGKWNGSSSIWTCCSVSDKFALGCRKLAS